MARFPPIPESELNTAQKRAQDGVSQLFSRFPDSLQWKNDEGLILGPYSPLFYTDDLSDPWYALAIKMMRQERFSLKEKELCIFAVLSEYDVPFVLHAHSQIGLFAGFSQEQVQQAVHGKHPENLSPRESAIYTLAVTLSKLRGPLRNDVFEKTRESLERDEIVGITHIVSGYVYVAMLSNISDAGVPEVKEGIFQATKNPKLALGDVSTA